MKFEQKLREAKKEFDELNKEHKGYHKKAMPEVKEYNLLYRKETGKYPYNASIKDFIIKKNDLALDNELLDYLETEVYLSQHDIDEDEKQAYTDKMLASGWKKLTRETEYRGKILLQAKKSTDWLTQSIEQEAKIIESVIGYEKDTKARITVLFIIPKGKRSRGWYVSSLENAFYKPLSA